MHWLTVFVRALALRNHWINPFRCLVMLRPISKWPFLGQDTIRGGLSVIHLRDHLTCHVVSNFVKQVWELGIGQDQSTLKQSLWSVNQESENGHSLQGNPKKTSIEFYWWVIFQVNPPKGNLNIHWTCSFAWFFTWTLVLFFFNIDIESLRGWWQNKDSSPRTSYIPPWTHVPTELAPVIAQLHLAWASCSSCSSWQGRYRNLSVTNCEMIL